MFLKRLVLHNIRSIEELEMSFGLPGDTVRPWTLLLGENGLGKTNILRSIALILAGSAAMSELIGKPDNWIRKGKKECRIEADLVTAEGQQRQVSLAWSRGQDIRKIFERNKASMDQLDAALKHTNRSYFMAGYGASRRLGASKSSVRSVAPRDVFEHIRAQCVGSLFSNDAVLNPLDTWAMDLDYRQRSGFKVSDIRKTLASLLPGVRLSRIDRQARQLMFKTPDGEVPLELLSDGYQNMAAWIGDLIFRITEAYANYKQPLKTRGLLLIDEIDLHLHPTWQRLLRDFLQSELPNFQIIATTHSPLTAQQAGEGELFFLRRSDQGQVELTQYQGAPNKLFVHQVLQIPAFGLTSMQSREVEKLKEEYKTLKAAPKKSGKPRTARLDKVKAKLNDLPQWSRETPLEQKQTKLLEEIRASLDKRSKR